VSHRCEKLQGCDFYHASAYLIVFKHKKLTIFFEKKQKNGQGGVMACGARCKTQFCNETMKHPVFAKQKWPPAKN